jgi:hypothetical protein
MHVYRSINEPIREGLSWNELWRGQDQGLIICWEMGRNHALSDFDLADKAKRGELPLLAYKGGTDRRLTKKERYGSLDYLAQWQGLRGEDLNVFPDEEKVIICTKTEMEVTYTSNKYILTDPVKKKDKE